MDDLPIFRAPKRRKFAKPTHAETLSDTTAPVRIDDDGLSSEGSSDDEASATVSRSKKPIKTSRLGVTFTSNGRTHAEDGDEVALAPVVPADDRLKDMTNRFVGTTGQVVDVDKHMMAYIDSEMARRRQPAEPTVPPNTTDQGITEDSPHKANPQPIPPTKEPQRQHQLAEVDLPPDTATAPPPPKRHRKPRLGRDGKPLRSRRPTRRNSSDLARDALVEQVLHENRLDHYQPQTQPPTVPAQSSHAPTQNASPTRANPAMPAHGQDPANDEAFALRFQREFEEGLAERQALQLQKRKEGQGDKDKEKSGPRLGGSRSARAKMVAHLREAEKEKGKSGR